MDVKEGDELVVEGEVDVVSRSALEPVPWRSWRRYQCDW